MNAPGLLDKFSRRINYLRVSVTDRCNLRCVYCMPVQGLDALPHGEILSYEEILRVVRISVGLGITKVRITGGEPLVRRGIAGLLKNIAGMPGVEDLSLTTNGILLAPMARELKECGLRRVNISLDTLKPEVFERITCRPGLSDVLEGIDRALKEGLSPVKVNVVAMRGVNDGEILAFADFAARKGIEVRFIEFMPSRREVWAEDSYVPSSEILEILKTGYDLEPIPGRGSNSGPGRVFRLPGAGRVGVISPLSDHFCGSCNRLRLTSDGRLRSCLFSDTEIDLKARLRDGSGDGEITELLRRAVAEKPERHDAANYDSGHCGMSMSRIGG